MAADRRMADREPRPPAMRSIARWRNLVLETVALLALMSILRHWFFGSAEIPGMPHPYWLPVVLVSCQYGVSGGMIAAIAASAVYLAELSPQSAEHDFYAYAGMIAVQPAAWLATALVVGGLRNLHIHQSTELVEQLAACRRCASDLGEGLERATAEINALERRIALDTGSVAALSRSISVIDMSDRQAAAASFGELFRVGTGATTIAIYLKGPDGYLPVWAIEDDAPPSTKSIVPLARAAFDAATNENAECAATRKAETSAPGAECHVVRVPPSEAGSEPLAAIVCHLDPSRDARHFRRRADELSRALATILSACPDQPSEARR